METKDLSETAETAQEAAPPPIPWRKILTLVGSQGLSLTGDYVLLIAMSWTAVQYGGAAAVTILMLAASIPRSAMLIFGGAVADMLGPRLVLLRTTSARAVLLAAGTVVVLSVHWFWPLVVMATIEGVLLGLGSPSFGSIMPQLATRDRLGRANSLYAMVLRLSPIIGTPIGAWLIATGHLWPALLVVALTCSVSFLSLVYVTRGIPRPKRQSGESLVKHSADGVRLLGRNVRLRWMFVSAFCLDMAFGWPIETALPLLIKRRGWNVEAVGVVVAAFSAGALATSAVGAVLAHRISLRVRLVVSGFGIAVGITLMALMPSVVTLAVVAFLVGLLSGFNGPAIVTVYQEAAPESQMGAAMSTLALAGIATGPASIAVFGALALRFGVQTTWLLCGLVALAAPVAAVLALRHPAGIADAGTRPDGESADHEEIAVAEEAGASDAAGESADPVLAASEPETEKEAVVAAS